ncbi:MAG: sulfite exporter TauE/SafE family protein [Planctomycetota bacterium]|nr:sulfite exporter TauE/SafE family protein [Planctomycetota bacterium]
MSGVGPPSANDGARPLAGRAVRPFPLLLLGAGIGAYSTLCGIGGGVFAVPLLHYAYRMPMRTAVANSLVLVAASTASATLLEGLHAQSALRLDVVLALVAGSLVGSLLGFAIGKRVSTAVLKGFFALLLVGVAIQLLVDDSARDVFARGGAGFEPAAADFAVIAGIGFVAGILAPLLGIGGGLVAVPALLHLAPGLGFLAARACSMAMSTVAAWQSVWLYRRDGEIRSGASLWLAGGAVLGAAIGIQLVHVETVTRAARGLVAFALFFAAARFAWDLATLRRRTAP